MFEIGEGNVPPIKNRSLKEAIASSALSKLKYQKDTKVIAEVYHELYTDFYFTLDCDFQAILSRKKVLFERETVCAMDIHSKGIQLIKKRNRNFYRRIEYAIKKAISPAFKVSPDEAIDRGPYSILCPMCNVPKVSLDCLHTEVICPLTAQVIVFESRLKGNFGELTVTPTA